MKHVADPARVQVILLLADGERVAGALSGELGVTQAAASYHLALLRLTGLIVARREGKRIAYGLSKTGAALADAVKLVVR